MRTFTSRLAGLVMVIALATTSSTDAAVKKYQVTGIVISVSDKTLVVQKTDEKFEFERDASLKVEGELKVGAKVTVHYHMIADSVEVKK